MHAGVNYARLFQGSDLCQSLHLDLIWLVTEVTLSLKAVSQTIKQPLTVKTAFKMGGDYYTLCAVLCVI